MAVIKDEAYGHGLIPIADFLQDKVDWFCVAHIAEAVELRQNGIDKPILVFEIPVKGREHLYTKFNVTASISDLSVFKRLEKGTNCHLHFDTGMMRLGMLASEVEEVLRSMERFPHLHYSGIYTHFANADGDASPDVNQQINTFKDIRTHFPEELFTHTSNSAGTLYHHQKGVFDGIRPGISLYGYAPGSEIEKLQPIIEWNSNLMQVKKIRKGEAVGYGSTWKAPEDGWLGIVPVGYSDGVFRILSGKIKIEINGKLYPQVGTISMDYMAVFTGKEKFETGTKVTILRNGELSAKEWAMASNTISYEITTAINQKLNRIYLR
jgi:alanine racemase